MSLKIYSCSHKELSLEQIDQMISYYKLNQARSNYHLSATHDPLYLTSKPDYLLASQGTKLAAHLIYKQSVDLHFEVWQVMVHPDYWGKGLGDLLLQYFHSHILPIGQRASLEVSQENLAARNLYLRNHWHIARRRKNYYADGSDAYILELYKDLESTLEP